MSECEPCQRITCIVPNDYTIYNLEGIPPQQLPPVAPIPPPGNSNDAVYFNVTCTPPYPIRFSGILPSWISIDTSNNRFVGAAGTFIADNKADANAQAQSDLNTFGNAALSAGTLGCAQPACLSHQNGVNLTGFPAAITGTKTTSVRRAVIQDATTPKLLFINTLDLSTVASVTPPSSPFVPLLCPAPPGCFATSVNHFFIPSNSGNSVLVYTANGTFVATIAMPAVIRNLIYSPVEDKIYTAYPFGGFTTIGVIDPQTNSIFYTFSTGANLGTVILSYYPDKLILNSQLDGNLHVYNLPSLSVFSTKALTGPGSVSYSSVTGKLFFPRDSTTMAELDPVTLVVTNTYTMSANTLNFIASNPVTGAILVCGPNGLDVFDPVLHSKICTVDTSATHDKGGIVVDYASGLAVLIATVTSLNVDLYA